MVTERLEEIFTRIQHERMQGVPILHPRLRVEAIGFRPWRGCQVGVLVTPWFMNLIALPEGTAPWRGRSVGDRVIWALPAGPCEWLVAHEPELGDYLMSSLFSPMSAFADQVEAERTALRVLERLFSPSSGRPAVSRRAWLRGLVGNGGEQAGS